MKRERKKQVKKNESVQKKETYSTQREEDVPSGERTSGTFPKRRMEQKLRKNARKKRIHTEENQQRKTSLTENEIQIGLLRNVISFPCLC